MEPAVEVGRFSTEVNLENYSRAIYVDINSEEDGTGEKGSPFKTINKAIESINNAGKNNSVAVLVAGGIYEQNTINMVPWVSLYGGFDAKNWERDININATVLSGVQGSRTLIGADHCIIDGFKFVATGEKDILQRDRS